MKRSFSEEQSAVNQVTVFAAVVLFFSALTAKDVAAQYPAYGWHNAQIVGGGFTTGIIYNQTEPNLVYIRTDMGTAYRLNPVTNRWIPLLDWIDWDNWNLTGVESLATDPVDPNRLYIAAGTYTNDWAGNGAILCSTNKGKTFTVSNLSFKLGGNMPGRSIGERLAIDPHKNNILYFGARSGNGLWKSTDYGATWVKDTNFTAVGTYSSGGDLIGIDWIAFNPSPTQGTATQTIYVGVADTGNCIYRSTNGGATWSAVAGQPTGYLPHHGYWASNGMLYIVYSNTCGPFDGGDGKVYKYNTSTGAWTNITPTSLTGFGFGGLAVDAQHPNTIMVSSLELWWPDDVIFRSTDGGITWKSIWEWGTYPDRTLYYTPDISAAPWLDWGTYNLVPSPTVSPKLGWMIGSIQIDPFNSNKMRYVTGATIYGSDNLTAWDSGGTINISVKAMGEEQTAVQDLISPPAGAHLLSALGDLGGFRHADLNTVPARVCMPPAFTTGTSLDYAQLDCNYIVRVGNGASINYGWSSDNGVTWSQALTSPSSASSGMVALSANASKVVWAPSGMSVYYSTNINGSSWTTCSGLPADSRIASDRVNSNKFYGLNSAIFYISTNGGASFSATAATGLPSSGVVRAMPGIEGDVWIVGGSGSNYGVWHSTNSGTSFTKLSGIEQADNIGFGKAAPGKSYMAIYISAKISGIRGIYRSIDAGTTWVKITDDTHQFAYTGPTITGDPQVFGRIYLCTNGRGIVYGDFYGDFNGDGIVDIDDLYEFCDKWWLQNDAVKTLEVDLNYDGIIDFYEFSAFAQNWSSQ